MLKLSNISPFTPYSTEWLTHRLGKMTGSKISCIMGAKGIGEGGMTYIRSKVGELISGKSSEKPITTEDTIWGVDNEPKSLEYFSKSNNNTIILSDKHLMINDNYSVTPDGLLIVRQLVGEWEVETVETKSFKTYATHIEHCECHTAADIKKVNPSLYWQVLMQMKGADCLRGHAIFYHPDFPEDSRLRQGHVLFKRHELQADFKLMNERFEEARNIFNTKYNYLKSKL